MKSFSVPEGTILLLDSEPDMRAVIGDALESAGYLVQAAGDIGEAVDRLEESRPDLLVTRPYINSMPGRLAADYLRSKQPGLPVLIVAGFMDDDRPNVKNAVEDFHTFPKPFRREDLVSAVSELLGLARKEHGAASKP